MYSVTLFLFLAAEKVPLALDVSSLVLVASMKSPLNIGNA